MQVWISNKGPQPYAFHSHEWIPGDLNRIAEADITYDNVKNILKVRKTGACNINLQLNYQSVNYEVDKAQKYLVVRGTNLSTADGNSYLWWLNGINHGTNVKPVVSKTIECDGEQQIVIVWNLTNSGIYENFNSEYPNICQGATIFGVTSTSSDGYCEIHDINFVKDIDDYCNSLTTSVQSAVMSRKQPETLYDLCGRPVANPQTGIYLVNGKKIVIK